MKLLLFSRYSRKGASSRLRSFQYLPFLEKNNITVCVNTLFDDQYLQTIYSGNRKKWLSIIKAYLFRLVMLLKVWKFDLIWIEKEIFPWAPAWIEQALGVLKIPYIVDYDDAIFHKYDLNKSKFIRWGLGAKIDKVMKHAKLVIVGNEYLAQRALNAGAKWVEHMPTVVDMDRYRFDNNKKKVNMFTIGWIGTPKTAMYLRYIESALKHICSEVNVRLLLIGSGPVEISGINIEIHGWSEVTEVEEIGLIDVGIMPLPDEPWERGKCGYKLIQYMACGKPVVASPVGVNKNIVEHNITGILADTDDEWINALESMMKDHNLCKKMGRAARIKIEREYSLEDASKKMITLLQQAVSIS